MEDGQKLDQEIAEEKKVYSGSTDRSFLLWPIAIIALNLWQVRNILMERQGGRKMLTSWLLGEKGVCWKGGGKEG